MIIPQNAAEPDKFYKWIGNDGMCRSTAKPLAEIDIEAALQNSKEVNRFFLNKKYPLIVYARQVKYISPEACKHFSAIGNFFLGLNKPNATEHLFTIEIIINESLNWVKRPCKTLNS